MIHLVVERHATHSSFRLVDPGGRDLDSANEFLATLAVRGLSPRTTRAYGFDLVSFHRWLDDTGLSVEGLQAKGLITFIAALHQAGASPTTINRRLIAVRLFLLFATGKDLADGPLLRPTGGYYKGRGKDRALGLHALARRRPLLRVKAPRKLVDPLTSEEVRGFLRRTRRYRDLAIVHLLLLCGLRSCEVLALRRADVVFDDKRLVIQGKGQKERAMPLPELAADALRRYLRLERPQAAHDQLFVILQGKQRGLPMTAAGLRSLFVHRRKDPALKRANAHRFRHTFGADMARAGVRLPILQKMMGHESGTTTLQYINLSMDDIAAAYAQAMAEIKKRYQEGGSV